MSHVLELEMSSYQYKVKRHILGYSLELALTPAVNLKTDLSKRIFSSTSECNPVRLALHREVGCMYDIS